MFFNLHFVCFCLGFSFEFLSSSERAKTEEGWGEGEEKKLETKILSSGPFCRFVDADFERPMKWKITFLQWKKIENGLKSNKSLLKCVEL